MKAWRKLFDAQTPYAALSGIVDSVTEVRIEALMDELDANVALTDVQRIAAVKEARPLIHERTRVELEESWQNLRAASVAVQ